MGLELTHRHHGRQFLGIVTEWVEAEGIRGLQGDRLWLPHSSGLSVDFLFFTIFLSQGFQRFSGKYRVLIFFIVTGVFRVLENILNKILSHKIPGTGNS